MLKVKPSRKSLGKLSEVRDALGIVWAVNDAIQEEIDALTNTYVSDAQWAKSLDEVALVDPEASKPSQTMANNKREALVGLWNRGERVEPWRTTAYGVLAAMNTYEHHVAVVGNASRPERNMLNMVTGQTEKSDAATHCKVAKPRVWPDSSSVTLSGPCGCLWGRLPCAQ